MNRSKSITRFLLWTFSILGTFSLLLAGPRPEAEKLGAFDQPGERAVPNHRHWRDADGNPLPFQSDEAIVDFLRRAQVVSRKKVGTGTNGTEKLLLERDGIRMHAAFRTTRGTKYTPGSEGSDYVAIRDDHAFEVAAYRLNRMLGLNMVPPTVLREIEGKPGSLQVWVEGAMMEKDRRKKEIQPPDEWYWMSQMLTMHLVDNLLANSDRNQGNLLIDSDWEVWLIDHTLAFRPISQLFSADKVLYCDRMVWWNLRNLTREAVASELSGLLRDSEIDALFVRRDLLVKQIQELIDSQGADKVLFVWEGEAAPPEATPGESGDAGS